MTTRSISSTVLCSPSTSSTNGLSPASAIASVKAGENGTCSLSSNKHTESRTTTAVAATSRATTGTAPAASDSLVHALAGGLGSAIALALTYPLDQIRTFQQVADDDDADDANEVLLHNAQCPAPTNLFIIFFRPWRRALALIDKHGVGSLYRGIIPVIISMGISNYVYFFISHLLKSLLTRYRQKTGCSLGYFGHLATNTVAGIINVLVTTPLWVSSMRAKLSPAQGWDIFAILVRVYREEGIKALWSGTLPSLLLVINPVLQHFIYDQLKRHVLKVRLSQKLGSGSSASTSAAAVGLGSLEAFAFGALAKTIATLVSYPLQVAQSRLRQQSEGGKGGGRDHRDYTGTIDCLMHLCERKGWVGLFQGIESKLLQTVLTSAFMFLCYEQIYRHTKRALEFVRPSER